MAASFNVFRSDQVNILMQALEQPGAGAESVNVGLNQSTSLNELIAQLSHVAGRTLEFKYEAPRSGDIRHSRADNRRLLKYFTLTRSTSLSEGLSRLLESLAS